MSVTKLPSVSVQADLNDTLQKRRSIRSFEKESLTLDEIAHLLWAAQGITEPRRGLRTAPSAGALYPLEIYLITDDGLFHYLPHQHAIALRNKSDLRKKLSLAALGQPAIERAPLDIVITATYKRVTKKYGNRGIRYSHMEAGHAAQNILLEATALGLGAVPIGAFHDGNVKQLLQLKEEETPLYIIPIGKK